jgi:hypothetical protein
MKCYARGKNIIFGKGGGINIPFGPKYRPLKKNLLYGPVKLTDHVQRAVIRVALLAVKLTDYVRRAVTRVAILC